MGALHDPFRLLHARAVERGLHILALVDGVVKEYQTDGRGVPVAAQRQHLLPLLSVLGFISFCSLRGLLRVALF